MFRDLVGSVKKSLGFSTVYPADWLREFNTAVAASSGISVGPHNAMDCAAVSCAVKSIAETIGQLPILIYARGADGSKRRTPEHPVYRLVHDDVNEFTSASEFRESLTVDALCHGNGFAFINRVEDRPVELSRLAPDTVTVEQDRVTGEPAYKVSLGNGRSRALHYSDIIHLRGVGSPVKQAREAIALAMVMEQYAGRLFGNGARPGGVINAPENMPPEALAKLKAAWQAAHGSGNSGGTAVLAGATYQQIALSSVDAQFAELRAFAISEIARAFRVPPVLLMDYARQTWANAETGGQQFLTYTLMPWIKRWEAEIRLKLFSFDQRDTHFAEFLTDDLLRSDFDKRARSYALAISSRWLNPNEVRARENLPPYEGGDEYLNPNTTTGPAVGANDNPENGKDAA